MEVVRDRVALDRQPAPTACGVEPAFRMDAGRVLTKPDVAEIFFEVGLGAQRPEFPAEPKLRIRPKTTVWTRNSQRHARLSRSETLMVMK
jgi:hypothetical protein